MDSPPSTSPSEHRLSSSSSEHRISPEVIDLSPEHRISPDVIDLSPEQEPVVNMGEDTSEEDEKSNRGPSAAEHRISPEVMDASPEREPVVNLYKDPSNEESDFPTSDYLSTFTEKSNHRPSAEEGGGDLGQQEQLPADAIAVAENVEIAAVASTSTNKKPGRPGAHRRYTKRARTSCSKRSSSPVSENSLPLGSSPASRDSRLEADDYEALKSQSDEQQTQISDLEMENQYLRNVLRNQSSMSAILQSIENQDAFGVRLSPSVSRERRRSDEENAARIDPDSTDSSSATVGIGLHVSDNKVGVEYSPLGNIWATDEDDS